MIKKYFFVLLASLSIVFLYGCGEPPEDLSDKPIVEEEDAKSGESSNQVEDTEAENNNQEETIEKKVQNPSLPEMKVHYIDVGQADSTLVQFSDNVDEYTLLIDAGNWNSDNVINYLNAQQISTIDIAVGTHPDADHIGQLDQIIQRFEVGEVWLSGNTSTSDTFQRLLQAINSSGADYYEPRMGDEFQIGPLEIEILYPREITGESNEESISMRLIYGNTRLIFTGDAAIHNENEMVRSGMNLSADILQLGHHGSNTSTSATFLDAVNPELAIYSAGEDNPYGHPHAEVIDLLKDKGITIYGTDVHGTIIVTTDGQQYTIKTKDDGTITPSTSSDSSNKETKQENNSTPSRNGKCIDINSANLEKLQEIIHIGPERAKELLKLRPFRSVDDLKRVKGIGPSRISDIKSQGLACT